MIDSRRGPPRTAGRQLELPLDTRTKAPEPKPERQGDASAKGARIGASHGGSSCGLAWVDVGAQVVTAHPPASRGLDGENTLYRNAVELDPLVDGLGVCHV